MIALETFTFEAAGKSYVVEARNVVDAYGIANEAVRADGIALPQGAWMDRAQPRSFYWAEGNFFD